MTFTAPPEWVVLLGVLMFVVFAAVAAAAAIGFVANRARRAPNPDGPSLADRAEPLLDARTGAADAEFARLVEGTQLGLTPDGAIGWILLVGALSAAGVFFLLSDELVAGVAGLLGGGAVYLFFSALQGRRRRAIQEQLPDGTFQLSRALRSGLTVPAALRETAGYVPAPLSLLFLRLSAALTLGESTGSACTRVAEEVRLTEFDLFTAVLVTHARRGGNLPALLDRLANSGRDRNQYRGYFRSVTALSRVTAVFLALAAPFGLVLYLIFQPEMLRKFLASSEGQQILIAAVVLEVIGVILFAVILRRQDDY